MQMSRTATLSLSWLLVTAGLTLAGIGAYQYYESRVAQDEAAQEWVSQNPTEAPVPEQLPQPEKKTSKWVPYYDPYRLGETVAKLKLPHDRTPLFVVEGTDQKELSKGPGHMPGTALPGVVGTV